MFYVAIGGPKGGFIGDTPSGWTHRIDMAKQFVSFMEADKFARYAGYKKWAVLLNV